MKKSAYLFVSILLFSYSVFGQITTNKISASSNSQISIFKDKVVRFVNDTKSEEIIITVQEQSPIMELTINGKISSGKLDVEIVDPEGITLGKFTVKAKESDKKETSLGEMNKFLKEPEPGDWKIKISAVNATGKIKIKSNFENDYYINAPGKFTPDGDGNNDLFNLETYNITEVTIFQIYSRWGKLVFSSKKINEGWDGKVNNELQEPGGYYYIVNAKTASGQKVTKSGFTVLEK